MKNLIDALWQRRALEAAKRAYMTKPSPEVRAYLTSREFELATANRVYGYDWQRGIQYRQTGPDEEYPA